MINKFSPITLTVIMGLLILILVGSVEAQEGAPGPTDRDIDLCIKNKKACNKVCLAFDQQMQSLDRQCVAACDIQDKIPLIDKMIGIQKRVDLLGLEGDCVWNQKDFCGAIFDAERTYIDTSPSTASLDIGESLQLTGSIVGQGCDGPVGQLTGELYWRSLSEDIASVDQNGIVTGISPGVATIKVFSFDIAEIQGEAVISVECPASGATLDVYPSSSSISVDETIQLHATVNGPDCLGVEINWQSSDVSVASVSASGLVIGNSQGSAEIIASLLSYPTVYGEANINVNDTDSCDADDDGHLDQDMSEWQGMCCQPQPCPWCLPLDPEYTKYFGLTSCPAGPCGEFNWVGQVCVTGETRSTIIPADERIPPLW